MWGKARKPELEVVCSLTKAPVILFEPAVKQKIALLMEEYPHQEWLAHMVGVKTQLGNYQIKDISVPPHDTVGGAHAEGTPVLGYDPDKGYTLAEPKDCVGFIHSHNGMGAFHSGTDQDYVDRNYPVSITVSSKGGQIAYDAISYQKTPCGKAITLKCEVKHLLPEPLFDKDKFLKQAKANIDRGKAVYIYQPKDNPVVIPPKEVDKLMGEQGQEISLEEYQRQLERIWYD